MFRVTLVNLTEHRKDSWEYTSLLDALRVAKNIDTATPDDLMARPAMTDEFFNKKLWELLTMGFVYVHEDVMVFLWKLDGDEERPVVSALEMFTSISLPVDKPFVPAQTPVDIAKKHGLSVVNLKHYRQDSPVGDSNIVRGED